MKQFTTREIARMLHLPDARIRSYVRAGFVSPDRGPGKKLRFSFQDLVLLKTTQGLLKSRIPARRVFRMLSSLKRQLPKDNHLARIKIYADGRRVVAWDGRARWQPDSGQFLFNFDLRGMAERSVLPPTRSAVPELSAEHWFSVALELEKSAVGEARRAYLLALEADPTMADAHLNLGRLYHDAGDYAQAETHYRAAAEFASGDAAPHFNLGVLLEDLGRPQEAMRAYRRAVAVDPDFADAHYNLALLLESLGKKMEALAHLREARKLYGRT